MTNAAGTTTTETAAGTEQSANVAPEAASSKKVASRKKVAPRGRKTAKAAKRKKEAANAPKRAAKSTGPIPAGRAGTAKAKVLAMLGHQGGATLEQIRKATGWQAHTVRGFISILCRKHGLKIESSKREDGARVYSLAK